MLAINTQLSGLIMWNCGKFTWGSGTNDIRVWPCFSEMAPAPAAGTRRLPKKIWSHFVVLYATPRSHRSKPTPPLTFSASLPPFQSLCLSPHFSALNLLILQVSSSAPLSFCFSCTFFSGQERDKQNPQVPRNQSRWRGKRQSSRLLCNHYTFPASLPA